MHQASKLSIKIFGLICWICLLMAGCQKEGVYKPEKKISKIYDTSYLTGEKQLYQTWNWDGDLLCSISYRGGDPGLRFQYKGKQLSSIYELGRDNQYFLFHYDKSGKRLDSLEVYKDLLSGNPNVRHIAHYAFSYNEDGLISGYEEELYAYPVKGCNEALGLALQCAIPGLPDVIAHKIAVPGKQSKSDEEIWGRISVSFIYQGDNVTECLILTDDRQEEKYTLTYTDYLNPSYKLFQSTGFSSTGLYSKNLVKTCLYEHFWDSDSTMSYYENTEYEYEIEDNYPVKTTCNGSLHSYVLPEPAQTYTHVYYYEYCK